MTKKLLLLPSVLLGALLIAIPVMAQGGFKIDGTSVDAIDNLSSSIIDSKALFSGVWLGTDKVGYHYDLTGTATWADATETTGSGSPGAGSEYTIENDILLTVDAGDATGNAGVTVIATNDNSGVFMFGEIGITGTTMTGSVGNRDELSGFVFRNNGEFTGDVFGEGIEVWARGFDDINDEATDAIGIYFRDTARTLGADRTWWADISGEVYVGGIYVESEFGTAAGLVTGAVLSGGSVGADEIGAVAGDGFATGMQIFGDGATSTGTIYLGRADVVGDAATGLLIGGVNDSDVLVTDAAEEVFVGRINVAARTDAGDAFGVRAGAIDALYLMRDITAEAGANGWAYGVHTTGDTNIIVGFEDEYGEGEDYSVTISAKNGERNGAIFTTGALDIKVLYGSELMTDDDITGASVAITADGEDTPHQYGSYAALGQVTATSGDVTITTENVGEVYLTGVTAAGDLVVNNNNPEIPGWEWETIDLGVININGNATFNGTGVTAFDFVQSEVTGTGTVNSGAQLGFYSTADLEVLEDFDWETSQYDSWTWGDTDINLHIIDVDEYNEWNITADGVSFGGRRDGANISDGFVAAMSMRSTYAAWNAVRNHMISGSGSSARGYRGQSPCCEVAPCDPCGSVCGGGAFSGSAPRSAWVNYTGRSVELASEFHNDGWRLSAEGVQVGTDLFKSRKSQLGVLFGYEGAVMRGGVADRIKSDDVFLGFYGARVLRNGADVRGVFAYGWQDYDMNRLSAADNNLYTSSFKGYTTETNLELGKRLGAGSGWSLRPVIGLDVLTNNLKSAQERGAGGLAAAYDKTSLTQVFVRFGSDLRYQMRNFTLNSGLYYAYDINGADVRTRANGVLLSGSKPGRELLTFNVGGEYQLGRNFSLFGAYEGQAAVDRSGGFQHLGYVGGAVKW